MRLVLLTLTAFLILRAHDPISTKLTWTQEVSRIVYKRCAGCHREGGNAPMSLLAYAEARPWAKAIKEEVLNRRMPPWGAVKGFGDFRDDPSLTQDEITRIAEWVEGGAPEGEAIYLPFPPKPSVPPAMPRRTVVRGLKGPARLLGIRPLTSIESAQVVANLPDGSTIPLLWLKDYKAAWKRTFVYREPILIPKGTQVSAYPAYTLEFLIQ
jgi:hypothetical protein